MPGKVVVEYTMFDGASKTYTCTATYWDGEPYFRHEVVVDANADAFSFANGHEPMVEPHTGTGAVNAYEEWTEPIPHVAFASKYGVFALYTELGSARAHEAWEADGRMDLVHDSLGKRLTKGDRSDPIVYYLAVGAGDLGDAHALASDVRTSILSVSPKARLASVWADMKAGSHAQ